MAKLQQINEMPVKAVKSLVDSIDTVILDVDGVLLRDKAVIPGSDDAVRMLRSLGKNIGFVTNNTLYPVERLVDNLKFFEASEREIFTPSLALVQYLKQIGYDSRKDIYAITSSTPIKLLRDEGYTVIEYKDIQPTPLGENVTAILTSSLKALEMCKNVGLVFLDTDPNACHGALQFAQVILNHFKDIQLLTGMSDDMALAGQNINIICGQYTMDGMERWTNRKGIPVGKPSKALGELVNAKYNISDPSRVLMVGDNIDTDIAFGTLVGYKTCLVLSGICTKEQVDNWKGGENLKADFMADKFGDFHIQLKGT